MRKMILMMGLMMILFAFPGYAADIVNFNPGTTYKTTALTGYQTYGDMMNGMKVTATFSDGSSQTALWGTTGYQAGAAVGTGWQLAEVGDTFDGTGTWTLSNSKNSGITSLVIDAGAGDAVFDTMALGDISGTDGSARGWNFERTSSNYFDVTATYFDLVALTGFAPVGDLFRNLSLNFISPTGAVAGLYGDMVFHADTDNLKISGDIHPTPEPTMLMLLGFGLAGLVGLKRKIIG